MYKMQQLTHNLSGLVAFLAMSSVNLPGAIIYLWYNLYQLITAQYADLHRRGARLYNGIGLPYLFMSDVMVSVYISALLVDLTLLCRRVACKPQRPISFGG